MAMGPSNTTTPQIQTQMDELYARLNHLRSQRVPTAQTVEDEHALLAELNALSVHRDTLRKSQLLDRGSKGTGNTSLGPTKVSPKHPFTINPDGTPAIGPEAFAYTEQWCKGKNVKERRLQQLTKFKGDGTDATHWAVWHENFISECTSVGADEEDRLRLLGEKLISTAHDQLLKIRKQCLQTDQACTSQIILIELSSEYCDNLTKLKLERKIYSKVKKPTESLYKFANDTYDLCHHLYATDWYKACVKCQGCGRSFCWACEGIARHWETMDSLM